MEKKNWLWRAWRTFFQGAVSYLVVAVPALIDSDVSITRKTLIGVGMAAVCWGLGALMNIKPGTDIKVPISEEISDNETLISESGVVAEEITEVDEPVVFDEEFVEESRGEG